MTPTPQEYTIFNSATPVAITSSTDATPIVVTATSHGFSTNDYVFIYGHTTNVAANGIYKITRIDANSFSLQDVNTGANIAGSGSGAGSGGLVVVAPKILLSMDHTNVMLTVTTSGTATTTLKVATSDGKLLADSAGGHGDTPNFGATVTDVNTYQFAQIINLDDGSTISGSTGVVVAGSDISRRYEVNTNRQKYFTVIPTSWAQGSITVKAFLTNNI